MLSCKQKAQGPPGNISSKLSLEAGRDWFDLCSSVLYGYGWKSYYLGIMEQRKWIRLNPMNNKAVLLPWKACCRRTLVTAQHISAVGLLGLIHFLLVKIGLCSYTWTSRSYINAFDVHATVDRPCHKSQIELSLIDPSFQRGHVNWTLFLLLQARRGPGGGGTDNLALLPHVLHSPLEKLIILKPFSGTKFPSPPFLHAYVAYLKNFLI